MKNQHDSSPNLLHGKVAAILNARELVINIGQEQGVTVGMKFKVLAETPFEVQDPDTGKTIGIVDREKVRVQTTDVQPNLAVCRTYKTRRTSGLFFPSVQDLMPVSREEVETLKADSSSLPPPLKEEESYVKRGDRVVLLSAGEMESD